MRPVVLKPTIPAGERPKTYALDRIATGTGNQLLHFSKIITVYPYSENYKQAVWTDAKFLNI
jgi:hypothetical protein